MSRQALVYGNRKQDDVAWDASSPEKRGLAFLALFNYLDNMEMYGDLEGTSFVSDSPDDVQQRLYLLAKSGDPLAAETLLGLRQNREYESWHLMNVWDPLEQCA